MTYFLTRIRDQYLPKYGELVVLGLLALLVLAGNLDWIRQDTSPSQDVDANLYMIRTLTFVDKMASQWVDPIVSLSDLSYGGRPPLYQLMSIPFVLLFGRSMDSGLYVNLFFEILLLAAVYNIGKLTENGRAGLLAAIIAAGYPPLIHLARVYRPHFALAGCVALTIWMLLLLQKERSVIIAWFLGLSLAFGMWIHPMFLWVAPIPAAIFCLWMIFFQPHPPQISIKKLPAWFLGKLREPLCSFGLLPASLVSFVLVLAWYLTSGKVLYSIMATINSPETNAARGFGVLTVGFYNVYPSFWWYALTSPQAISTVFVALLAVGMAAGLIKRQFPILMLLTCFVIGYTALSLQGTLGWRYFAPLLPIAAALTGIWIVRLKNRIVSSLLILLCVATAIFNFTIVTWGLQTRNRSAASVLGVQLVDCASRAGFCPAPAVKENWPVSEILRFVLDDPACKRDVCDLMVAVQSEYLDWSVFKYYLQQDFPGMRVSIPTSVNIGGGIPPNLPALFTSDYLVYEIPRGQVEDPIIRLLQSPPPAFASAHEKVARFVLPNKNTAKLIKRIKPLTVEEAEAIIAALDLPNKYKTVQYDILAPLYAQEGNFVKSISYYELALKHTQDPKVRVEYMLETGRMYLSLGRMEEAIDAYQDALKLMPRDPRIHFGLAMVYASQGRSELAIMELRKILQYAPGSEYAWQAQEWLDTHK
jgi:4-amino-4-deoxy-L-arabinose transferase-like glycosyltransferase